MDYNNIENLINGLDKTLSVKTPTPSIPTPLIILGSQNKSGLSAIKIASRIISRKAEAGLPVGNLPSGSVSPEEIMWRIAIEEIIWAFQQEAIITVGIPPGTTVTAAGTSPAGPVTTVGSTITLTKGFGVIQ